MILISQPNDPRDHHAQGRHRLRDEDSEGRERNLEPWQTAINCLLGTAEGRNFASECCAHSFRRPQFAIRRHRRKASARSPCRNPFARSPCQNAFARSRDPHHVWARCRLVRRLRGTAR